MEMMSEFQTENLNLHDHVSFLALLMAPDDASIPNPYDDIPLDHHHQQNHHFLSPPPQTTTATTTNISQFLSPQNNDYDSGDGGGGDNNYCLPSLPPMPPNLNDCGGDHFSALPDLFSLENFAEPPPLKYPKLEQLSLPPPQSPPPPQPPQQFVTDDYSLESILHSHLKKPEENKISPPLPPPSPSEIPAKRRKYPAKAKRNRITDKLHELNKLMPANYGSKKTMVATLDAAFKYVKFLQAQVSALQSMPAVSRFADGDGGRGRLGRLTRQQMLQVAVNSAEAQAVMAEKGLCIVSAEQVAVLKRIEMRKLVVQQLLAQIPI